MNIGFIGAGHMGSALAQAISKDLNINIYIYDVYDEKAHILANKITAKVSKLNELCEICDFIFIGVKPKTVFEVVKEIESYIKPNTVLISMAAGIKIEAIEGSLNRAVPLIRIMPNTPVAVGEGLTAYSTNNLVSLDAIKVFEAFMQHTGTLVSLSEYEIDAFCALAGCGPAYAYMFIEALANGAAKLGIAREKALYYASKMLRGSALMATDSGVDPSTLCKNVCSPGGATIEGVRVLEASGFKSSVSSAIEAAYKRTIELSK